MQQKISDKKNTFLIHNHVVNIYFRVKYVFVS